MNAWTVYLDDFSDYTAWYSSSTIGCPLLPFCLSSNATNSTIFLTKNTDTAVYPSINTCLVVASYGTTQEVLYYHVTRLANYSLQYYTRVPTPGNISGALVRFNLDTAGKEYGYALNICASTSGGINNGKVKLYEIVASNYTNLTSVNFTITTSLSNMTAINPFEWFYVHYDISGNNIQVYLSTATTPIINMTVDTTSTIPIGGVGFRANYDAAYFYYERLDVQVQGSWKILYYCGDANGTETKYVDIATTNAAGTLLMSATTISALTTSLSGVTACWISSVCPTPFGDHIVYMLSTPTTAPTYGSAFFAMSSCDGSNPHVIWNPVYNQQSFPANFQELESVGVDGYAYANITGVCGRISLPDSTLGTFTLLTAEFTGPTVSPDGSYLYNAQLRKNPNLSYVTIQRVGTSSYVDVSDGWLMNGLAANDSSFAADTSLTAVSTNFMPGNYWAGFGNWYQIWDWGMKGIYFPEYGPNDSAPGNIGNNSIWYWNPHNGQSIQYKNLVDSQQPIPNSYPGYWDCPSPDPRWAYPNQFMASYQSPDSTGTPGYWHNYIYWVNKSTQQVITPPITYEVGTNGDPWGAIFWNKPD